MLRSFEKVFVLLDAFTHERPEWSLADLTRKVGMAKPTVHHIMSTLIKGGWVDKDPDTRRFRLGIRLWEKGWIAISQMGVREVARPHVEALMESSGETVRLGILDHSDPRWVIYIDRVESQHAVRAAVASEVRSPSYGVATGKAMLAHHPELVSRILAQDLRSYTKGTLTSATALQRDLALTRQRGYSMNNAEYRNDVVGIAAPIWSHEGRVVAAIGISGPAYRITPSRIRQLGDTVVGAASEISRRLGHVSRGESHARIAESRAGAVSVPVRRRSGAKLPIASDRGARGIRSRGRQ